jgi:hypothetical protein
MKPLPLALKQARQNRKKNRLRRLFDGIDQSVLFGLLNLLVVALFILGKALL